MAVLSREPYPSEGKPMFLNTKSSGVQGQPRIIELQGDAQVAEPKHELLTKYWSIPREINPEAIYYQAAVRSCLAAPYLLLHHQYHLQIAFLTQASEDSSEGPIKGTVSEDGSAVSSPPPSLCPSGSLQDTAEDETSRGGKREVMGKS
ncbi:MAG: hypothetical protein Q9169_001439 [Polycauliona sp. 2 TL-2023]